MTEPTPGWTTARCDSCGAGLPPDADRCDYCGQAPVILVRGTRLRDLLRMYLDAEQHQDVMALSTEILRDHPRNALAWAAKGLGGLMVATNADPGSATPHDVDAALRCLRMATELAMRSSEVEALRLVAGKKALGFACGWGNEMLRQTRANPTLSVNEHIRLCFIMSHSYAMAAEQLDPSLTPKVDDVLRITDDFMERTYGLLYEVGDYQERRRPRGPTAVAPPSSLGEAFKRALGL